MLWVQPTSGPARKPRLPGARVVQSAVAVRRTLLRHRIREETKCRLAVKLAFLDSHGNCTYSCGSTHALCTSTIKWTCGPVEAPVLPSYAIICPFVTVWPTFTI